MMSVFDSHCHLDAADFDADRAEVVARAVAAGVCGLIVPATDRASCHKTLSLVETLQDLEVFGAVGVHPHESRELTEEEMLEIAELSTRPRVVAIGETGLDYHYNFSSPEVQRDSLRWHVRLALRRNLPLVLHCRNAEADLLTILEEEGARQCGGVVHCFTGDWDGAQRLLALGFFLGFTGIITFRNADKLREVVRRVPLERVLLETDSPYLAPIPFRGKRNEPSHVVRVAEAVASLHGVSPDAAARTAMENTRRCFHLPLAE